MGLHLNVTKTENQNAVWMTLLNVQMKYLRVLLHHHQRHHQHLYRVLVPHLILHLVLHLVLHLILHLVLHLILHLVLHLIPHLIQHPVLHLTQPLIQHPNQLLVERLLQRRHLVPVLHPNLLLIRLEQTIVPILHALTVTQIMGNQSAVQIILLNVPRYHPRAMLLHHHPRHHPHHHQLPVLHQNLQHNVERTIVRIYLVQNVIEMGNQSAVQIILWNVPKYHPRAKFHHDHRYHRLKVNLLVLLLVHLLDSLLVHLRRLQLQNVPRIVLQNDPRIVQRKMEIHYLQPPKKHQILLQNQAVVQLLNQQRKEIQCFRPKSLLTMIMHRVVLTNLVKVPVSKEDVVQH